MGASGLRRRESVYRYIAKSLKLQFGDTCDDGDLVRIAKLLLVKDVQQRMENVKKVEQILEGF